MIYWRCRCGKTEYWESGMPPQRCQSCADCGSTLATRSADHKTPIAHDWEARFNPRTEARDRRTCRRCYATERVVT